MKKVTSLVLALLIAGSGSGNNVMKAYASDRKDNVSIENSDFKSTVKDTLGWTNLDKEIILGNSLTILLFGMDNKRYILAAHAEKINDDRNILFTDIEDGQPIFEILRTNSNADLTITKDYDYFDTGAIFSSFDMILFDNNTFEYHIQESIPDDFSQPMSISRLAELLLKIKFLNIQSCYIKSEIKTFDELEYNNIVPNTNDNEYIKLDDFGVYIEPAKKINFDGYDDHNEKVVFFVKKGLSSNGAVKSDEIFLGINLMHMEISSNGNVIKYYNSVFDKTHSISREPLDFFLKNYYPEATSYFRDIVEVIDGKKYFNVGKLRKIYENLDPSIMVDYDKLLNMDTTKFLPMK